MRTRPDLQISKIRTLQPLHHCSVGYQPSTTCRNLILPIWMKRITRGVQELDSKGLIDTVEEIKNGGPGSIYKDLSPQIQRYNVCFSKEITRLNKTLILGGGY